MNKMKNIFIVSVSIILPLIFNSCSKLSPAEFWRKFNTELIVTKSSDQGPYGGERQIEWKNLNGKIKSNDFLKFANENGWKLIDSIEITNNELNKNKLRNLDKYAEEIIIEEILPKISNQNSKIFIFKTGWIRIKPGNEIETEQNGFLVSEDNSKTFKLFQNWGE